MALLPEGVVCIITDGEHKGKRGVVDDGRHTIKTATVKIGDEVVEVPHQYVEEYRPE